MRPLIIAALAAAILGAAQTIDSQDRPGEPVALCSTDTDCMRFCPPPADDPDCDGGPQAATAARGNYGSQP